MLLALLAGTAAYAALADRSATTPVVVAARFIPAGARVGPGDTRTVAVHTSDAAQEGGLVPPSRLGQGWVAAVPLERGEPVTEAELTLRTASRRTGQMSIPVPVQDAVGGRFAPGDAVDVILAGSSQDAHYVAQGLHVVAVAPASAPGAFGGGTADYYVVVQVDKRTALRIAGALAASTSQSGASLELVLSTGEAPLHAGRRPAPAGHAVAGAGAPR